MNTIVPLLVVGFLFLPKLDGSAQEGPNQPPRAAGAVGGARARWPIGPPGQSGRYRIEGNARPRDSVVTAYTLAVGPTELRSGAEDQWMLLDATKTNGERFRVWILAAGYPAPSRVAAQKRVARYILQENEAEPLEFCHGRTGQAVLPTVGGWPFLLPRASGEENGVGGVEVWPRQAQYLGHRYQRESVEGGSFAPAPLKLKRIELWPDVMIGVPSNTRTKEDRRRFDNSDYEMVRLTESDYREMADAGLNCFRVDAGQVRWVDHLSAFYWGVGGKEVSYPECLYRSSYLGPVLFLDEPAVGTRDYMIRPKLEKDAAFRRSITPQIVLEAFQEHFREVLRDGAPTSFLKGLKARADVALGDMELVQENLFTWETVESTAAYQLSQDPRVPAAMVFEPPGRVGTLRTLPELNMTYGCQLPVDDPKNLADIIYGFMRGAARLTGKSWGMSIYGAVDQADAPWFLTHAYDSGATRFFFWDNYRLACVPYRECLALASHLRAHARSYPRRDLDQLKHAAEVAILLPPGYNLGHVQLGKGCLWGLDELNLERVNQKGVTYRTVMTPFFLEIERALRLGTAFDLLWDWPEISLSGYREIIRVREDGKVEVNQDGLRSVLDQARPPIRPAGGPPGLEIALSASEGKAPLNVSARAIVTEKSAPVFYTLGADAEGIYQNAVVAWEVYGPGEEDHRFLQSATTKLQVDRTGPGYDVRANFSLTRPGQYRLRAATVDRAGRSQVIWRAISVAE